MDPFFQVLLIFMAFGAATLLAAWVVSRFDRR
jgi:hypothetical protein